VIGHDLLNLTEGSGGPTEPDVLFTPDEIVGEIGGLQVEKAERVRRPADDGVTPRDAARRHRRARARAKTLTAKATRRSTGVAVRTR